MPRNVRNWWVTGKVDGGRPVSFGPQAGDQGFSLTVQQRDNGAVTTALHLEGYWLDGTLTLKVAGPDGVVFHEHVTHR